MLYFQCLILINIKQKDKMMKKSQFTILFAMIAILSGCGTGRVLVLDSIKLDKSITGVTIEPDKSTVFVQTEIKEKFEKHLREKLDEAGFKENKDLTLCYRFIQMNEGNRFGRWFFGGIGNVGEGTLTAEIKYLDSSRQEIGKIQSEGKIGSGAFGGGFDNAVESAVEEIVRYTKQIAAK